MEIATLQLSTPTKNYRMMIEKPILLNFFTRMTTMPLPPAPPIWYVPV